MAHQTPDMPCRLLARRRLAGAQQHRENGGAKLDHGGGGEVLLRAA
jgi:hypothetical protein